jgi:hypothetical protein
MNFGKKCARNMDDCSMGMERCCANPISRWSGCPAGVAVDADVDANDGEVDPNAEVATEVDTDNWMQTAFAVANANPKTQAKS